MNLENGSGNASGGRKILFYTDALHFGGHEVASLHALESLLESGNQVHVVFRENNRELHARLERLKRAHPDLELTGLDVPPLKYPDLSWVLYRNYLEQLRRLFGQVAPGLVFVSQGNLAISWAGTRTAHELQIPCLSYIPMAQPLRTLLGAKGWLRDFLGRRVLDWPDHWLTCSEAPWEHYAALDLLVMPSRFEGQPLAMQGALLCGVPICGSDIDGLADYLPRDWLCPPGDASGLRRKMEAMLREIDRCGSGLASARERVQAENRLENVMRRLNAALLFAPEPSGGCVFWLPP